MIHINNVFQNILEIYSSKYVLHVERIFLKCVVKIFMGMIMASLASVQRSVVACRNSFELYGYDVLLDETLRPWLLEVNASPSLNATDAHDFRLKFDLVDDVLNVLDLERKLTGREIRIGGFDLLWDDAPVYCQSSSAQLPRKLNIFLGAYNDRVEQLQALKNQLITQNDSPLVH